MVRVKDIIEESLLFDNVMEIYFLISVADDFQSKNDDEAACGRGEIRFNVRPEARIYDTLDTIFSPSDLLRPVS